MSKIMRQLEAEGRASREAAKAKPQTETRTETALENLIFNEGFDIDAVPPWIRLKGGPADGQRVLRPVGRFVKMTHYVDAAGSVREATYVPSHYDVTTDESVWVYQP